MNIEKQQSEMRICQPILEGSVYRAEVGSVCAEYPISLINGPYISYYESGSIKEICNYTFGRITGPYFKFYENGTSQIVGSYKQITDLCEYEIERDSVISHEFMEETITLINRLSSIREGRWATYDSNGTLISEIYY